MVGIDAGRYAPAYPNHDSFVMNELFLTPDWPAPNYVQALSSTRLGGVSKPPYDSLNLGSHVGDDASLVRQNRLMLKELAALPNEPDWLHQVHGQGVVQASNDRQKPVDADASWTDAAGVVCAVQTADCLPVLFCCKTQPKVAAAHAGWRGLSAGVLEQTLASLNVNPQEIMAWLGPAIGPAAFQVGTEVREAFVSQHASAAAGFVADGERWLADIYALARIRLAACGVNEIYGGGHCTFREDDLFFSYRRDKTTGRQASMIWIDEVMK